MTKDELAASAHAVATAEAGQTRDGDKDAHYSTPIPSTSEKRRFAQIRDNEFARRVWKVVSWTPERCRWDPESPPKFSLGLNLLFGFVSIFC